MYEYSVARVLDVYDGDTCHLEIDLGMHVSMTTHIRVAHINAPELHQKDGAAAKARFIELLSFTPLIIKTERDRTEKFGRWLGTIINSKGADVGQTLIDEGLAVKYEGGRR